MTKIIKSKALEYYVDETLDKKMNVTEEGNVIVDFDKVKPGESKTVSFFIQNQTKSPMVLEAYKEDEDLQINHPRTLSSAETGEVFLTFSPKEGRLEPLNANWGFKMVIGR